MAQSGIGETNWPRKTNGSRRRSSAPRKVKRQRFSRPAGWLVRVFLLAAIALPSLLITSPGYAAYAAKLPSVTDITNPVATDSMIYAADGTTLLADLHPPGYQHYEEPLANMGTLLPAAIIAIEDRNFYQEPGVDAAGV